MHQRCSLLVVSMLVAAGAALRSPPPRMSASMRKAGWFPGGLAPSYLDGSLPGDVGFDPLALVALAPTGTKSDSADNPWRSQDRKTQLLMMGPYELERKVKFMREAEVKHARLAMMAAVGWPMSELLDAPLSKLLGLPYALEATGGRAPSLFNGHLFEGPQAVFLLLVALATAGLEVGAPSNIRAQLWFCLASHPRPSTRRSVAPPRSQLKTLDNVEGLTPSGYVAGDLGFDPAGLMNARDDMALAEIKHGRLAMLAVTGYAVQEFLYRTPVIEQSPQFFRPFFL